MAADQTVAFNEGSIRKQPFLADESQVSISIWKRIVKDFIRKTGLFLYLLDLVKRKKNMWHHVNTKTMDKQWHWQDKFLDKNQKWVNVHYQVLLCGSEYLWSILTSVHWFLNASLGHACYLQSSTHHILMQNNHEIKPWDNH